MKQVVAALRHNELTGTQRVTVVGGIGRTRRPSASCGPLPHAASERAPGDG